jgi:esterase/lipase
VQSIENTELFKINSSYDWCARAFRVTRKLLKLNIKLHDDGKRSSKQIIDTGDIFLFNHFARFETFIPQYLMYEECGVYCRSIAANGFFSDERFAAFLRGIGVVPNNMPDLFPFIAREILHGRKLIIFPEGGMVKDKRVIDHRGRFSIYSRTSLERRKHHRGAAVIALALDAFKTTLLRDYSTGQYAGIERWAEQLGFDDVQQLMMKAIKPTTIVPSHITFYPLRVNDNILYQAARLVNKGINKRFAEELIIEGNLLFKHTDMDIRFASPQIIGGYWKWWEKYLLPNAVHRFESLNELFNLTPDKGHWGGRLNSIALNARSQVVRDDYMHAMYQAVTVNLSHIASWIILHGYRQNLLSMPFTRFHKLLYVCVKQAQCLGIYLHRSLHNPDEYRQLLDGDNHRLQQFLNTAIDSGLLREEQGAFGLEDKLTHEFDFDAIRTENLISVYANEVSPLSSLTRVIQRVIKTIDRVDQRQIAEYRFNDELLTYEWDLKQYNKPRHEEINSQQTSTRDGRSIRWLSKQAGSDAVVLVHGFLASPAEMQGLGDRLAAAGYSVFAPRLRGHATSPWDLRDRDWQDWAASVQRGVDIARAYCQRVHLVGFSTGGLLALNQASEYPGSYLASVTAICAPVDFHNKNLRLVPLIQQANKIMRWVSEEGLMPFRPNPSEHPEINYAHIPVRSLHQLQKLIVHFFAQKVKIECPVTLMQATHDPVVVASSVERLYQQIDCEDKQIQWIDAARHGVVYDDIDDTQDKIIDGLRRLQSAQADA